MKKLLIVLLLVPLGILGQVKIKHDTINAYRTTRVIFRDTVQFDKPVKLDTITTTDNTSIVFRDTVQFDRIVKGDTIAPNKKTLTIFTRKVKADSLITTGLPVNSSPDSVITVGSDQLVSKTATTPFTSIAITSKDAGSIFFKQTSTGNFSASNKFYFDSTNTRICIGGTGVSHSPKSRVSIVADSSRTATKYMFNIVDPSINKNRTDWAKATDTSSVNFSFTTNTGKPMVNVKNNVGTTIFDLDSAGIIRNITVTTMGSILTTSYLQGMNLFATGNIYGGYVTTTTTAIIGANSAQRSATTGKPFIIQSGDCKATTANLSGGSLSLNSGISTGSGSSSVTIATSGGGIVGGTTDLTATTKLTINGVGGLIFTPLNTALAGADSIKDAGTIWLKDSVILSNKGAYNLWYNQKGASKELSASLPIDTTNAKSGQVIKITNVSPTNSTLLIQNEGTILLNGGVNFTMNNGDCIELELIKINNRKWWRENNRSDVTTY